MESTWRSIGKLLLLHVHQRLRRGKFLCWCGGKVLHPPYISSNLALVGCIPCISHVTTRILPCWYLWLFLVVMGADKKAPPIYNSYLYNSPYRDKQIKLATYKWTIELSSINSFLLPVLCWDSLFWMSKAIYFLLINRNGRLHIETTQFITTQASAYQAQDHNPSAEGKHSQT